MLKYLTTTMLIFLTLQGDAQNESKHDSLPFQNITEYPTSFSSENMLVRMIDGLGFRLYWVTDGLREEDLAYRPNPEARSCEETIDHIMGLSVMILNAVKNLPNTSSGEETSLKSFGEKRKITLENLFESRQILAADAVKIEDIKIIFERNNGFTELPVWNLINGPISDAIWHVGQMVSFRRSSGNPLNSKVNVMMGKRK